MPKKKGYEVIVATAGSEAVNKINVMGFRYIVVPFSRRGQGLIREAIIPFKLFKMMRGEKPDI